MKSRSARRQMNKTKNEYVIKCGMKKSINPTLENACKIACMNEITKRVESASKFSHRLGLAMNLWLKEQFDGKVDYRYIVLPDFLTSTNSTFMCQMMKGTESAISPDPVVKDFYTRNAHIIPTAAQRLSADTNTLVRGCEQYRTNFRTFIITNFNNLQKKWSYNVAGIHRTTPMVLRHLINGWTLPSSYESDISRMTDHDTLIIHKIVSYHREVLGLAEGERLSEVHMKKNYEKIIVYNAMLNKKFEKVGQRQILSAPLCNIKAHFIHIDTSVLYGVMKNLEIFKGKYESFDKDRTNQWRRMFSIDKLLTIKQRTTCEFTGT
jgi:hypothetical protein